MNGLQSKQTIKIYMHLKYTSENRTLDYSIKGIAFATALNCERFKDNVSHNLANCRSSECEWFTVHSMWKAKLKIFFSLSLPSPVGWLVGFARWVPLPAGVKKQML